MFKATGGKLAIYDVDAPLEVSLAGVLERVPGGNDPLPSFEVVAKGFEAVRRDRVAVAEYFLQHPDVGTYELFATSNAGDKVKVMTISGGRRTVQDESLAAVTNQDYKGIAESFGNTRISWRSIEKITESLSPARAEAVRQVLRESVGTTWKHALDFHSERTP